MRHNNGSILHRARVCGIAAGTPVNAQGRDNEKMLALQRGASRCLRVAWQRQAAREIKCLNQRPIILNPTQAMVGAVGYYYLPDAVVKADAVVAIKFDRRVTGALPAKHHPSVVASGCIELVHLREAVTVSHKQCRRVARRYKYVCGLEGPERGVMAPTGRHVPRPDVLPIQCRLMDLSSEPHHNNEKRCMQPTRPQS